ncbi:MAG TPA: GTPase Era [Chitinophagales bacterium]|nr:GTPase Era [Chitinophagales bacterium]
MSYRSGFVNIIGRPNVGKSTLLNVLIGEKLSIITPKAQTTRRRILGIVTTDQYQAVFSDTPGLIDQPEYKLHQWMNAQVSTALKDGDVLVFMTDPKDELNADHPLIQTLQQIRTPVIVVINKSDIIAKNVLEQLIIKWTSVLPKATIISISALQKINTDKLFQHIVVALPVHPPYYDNDTWTDQTERVIAAEIVREKIFMQYQQEIPYNVEVIVDSYKDKGDIIAISAVIYVGRDSHKSIIIGKSGSAIKNIGIAARQDIEKFAGKKIFLELFVKVRENWKNDDRGLKHFGYE